MYSLFSFSCFVKFVYILIKTACHGPYIILALNVRRHISFSLWYAKSCHFVSACFLQDDDDHDGSLEQETEHDSKTGIRIHACRYKDDSEYKDIYFILKNFFSASFSVNSRSYHLEVTPSDENCYVESSAAIMVILIVVSQTLSKWVNSKHNIVLSWLVLSFISNLTLIFLPLYCRTIHYFWLN